MSFSRLVHNRCVSAIRAEGDHGCSPATCLRRSVMELRYERNAFKNFADNLSLDADAAPVNDAHQWKPLGVGLIEVRFYGLFHVTRRERMQIERIFYRKLNSLGLICIRIEHGSAALFLKRRPAAVRVRRLLFRAAFGKRRGGHYVAKIQLARRKRKGAVQNHFHRGAFREGRIGPTT